MADFRLTIEIKDAAEGDVRELRDAILEAHGEDFDAALGDFAILAAIREGADWGAYFPLDLDDDE